MREDVYHLTQRQLEEKIRETFIPQQISKLERGKTERPSMHDLCRPWRDLRACLPTRWPSSMATGAAHVQTSGGPETREGQGHCRQARPPWRDRLLDVLETDAVLWASQANATDLLEELG